MAKYSGFVLAALVCAIGVVHAYPSGYYHPHRPLQRFPRNVADYEGREQIYELIPVERVQRSIPFEEEEEEEERVIVLPRRVVRGPPPPPSPRQASAENERDYLYAAPTNYEPVPAATGDSNSHYDYVDYGAYTGGHGAFGWYSDHPVHVMSNSY